ncbi:hypothetical protein [Chitinophaga sp. GbtcB8]|uniref:hypothetical protein n=1 Tax=Chitinophaga sp. GbtcB8 TaxID=2824753 RepID=UPI001C2FECBA|nr:hypothetical protein [Chitinophaga sp. GbtcB8]
MSLTEKEYIARCKQLIGEQLRLVSDDGTLRQRDLESLADSIEERSGIRLSLSTLKRLWKKDYDQVPHPSTLQALVSVLGYKDWQEFRLKQAPLPAAPVAEKPARRLNLWMILPAVAALVVFSWLIAFRSGQPASLKPVVKGPVTFTGNKTVAQGVPNTIVFNYDVRNVVADSFFFQQSWNEQERVKIDPGKHYYSAIYYYPGFHRAKLIANDSILKRFKVHITTDGWFPLAHHVSRESMPVYLPQEGSIRDGALHISTETLVASHIDVNKDFTLSYFNVREFEDTYSDNFSLDTRVILDSTNLNACPGLSLVVMCEEDIFFVCMIRKGCERNSNIKMGEVYEDGVQNDLSSFGRDLYKWQQLQIQVVNKQATISLDGQPVRTIRFKKDFGKIMGLAYHFTGPGGVDYVKLKNGKNKMVYEDEFGK